MKEERRHLTALVTKVTRAFPILLIIGGMILSFAAQPLSVVGMSSTDRQDGSKDASLAIGQLKSAEMWKSSGPLLQVNEGYGLEFTEPHTAICMPEPGPISATLVVTLPEGVTAQLQAAWHVVEPPNKRTPIQYIDAGTVSDGDTFTFEGQWPGIDPGDEVVEIHFGGALLDPTGEPYVTANLDYYWYPWVCPVGAVTPTPTAIVGATTTSTPTVTVETPVADTSTPTQTDVVVTPVTATPTPTPTLTETSQVVGPPLTATATPIDTSTPIVVTGTPIVVPGPVISATPIVLIPPPIQATPVVIIPPPIQATPVVIIPPPIQATPVVMVPPPIQATPVVIIPPPIQATPVVMVPAPIQATPVVIIPPPVQATPVVIIPPPIQATPVVIVPAPIQATPVVMVPAPIQATPQVIIPPPIHATPVVIIPPPIQATPVVIVPEPVQATPVVLAPSVITATPIVVEAVPLTGGEEPPVDKPVIPTLQVPVVEAGEEFIPVTGADLTELYAQQAVVQDVNWKVALQLLMSIAGLVSILAGVIFLFSPNRS